MKTNEIVEKDIVIQEATAIVWQVVSEPVSKNQMLTSLDKETAKEFFFLKKIGFSEIKKFSIKEIKEGFRLFVSSETLSVVPKPPTLPLFVQFQTLVHVRSGRKVTVIMTPEHCRIESTGGAAYAYSYFKRCEDGQYTRLPEVWIRSQSEMEDGRFVIAGNDNLLDQKKLNKNTNRLGEHTVAAIQSITTEPTRGTK